MDLVTLITAWALNVEPKLMHALIWKQSGGEPWSFSRPGESLPRALPTLVDPVGEAQATRAEGDRIRVGLTGLSINSRSVTPVTLAPCPNVTFVARQLTQLVERCNTTSNPDPTYCAIAAYRGSRDRPDTGFADAVRATAEGGSAPNFDLPKDAYFDEAVLRDWGLPPIDLWAVFPAGWRASTKARTFTKFVEEVNACPTQPSLFSISPVQ
jgi:hypothetical protein